MLLGIFLAMRKRSATRQEARKGGGHDGFIAKAITHNSYEDFKARKFSIMRVGKKSYICGRTLFSKKRSARKGMG